MVEYMGVQVLRYTQFSVIVNSYLNSAEGLSHSKPFEDN